MKRKLRRRNQHWLSEQCRRALLNDVPMSFFIRFPGQQADMKNGQRLERRGRLLPDWSNAKFYRGYASLPFVSAHGRIYHYQMFLSQGELPEAYRSCWLDND